MKLTALRTFRFGNTNIRRGAAVTMSEACGKEHLALGLVRKIETPSPKPKAEPKAKAKVEEKAKG